jgi:ATP-binding cassette subfamily B protein
MFYTFPNYKQLDQMDCGPTCVRIIAKHYGRNYSSKFLRDRSYVTREGTSLLGMSDTAEAIGFRTLKVKTSFEKLSEVVPLPCIVYWNQRHFIVVYKIKKNHVYVSDPIAGLLRYTKEEFLKGWTRQALATDESGIVLMLEPTEEFYENDESGNDKKSGFKILYSYVKPYKKLLTQLFIGLIIGSLIQLILPFLTQTIVDVGINTRNINFLYVILSAQMALFAGRAAVDLLRRWILLHLSTRVNIALISDFLIKLMQLPLSFFDTKKIGDLLQRINDHSQIQNFLSTTTLSILFSFINLIIFGAVLAIYNITIFTVFFTASALYLAYVLLFLKKQRILNYKKFSQQALNQSNLIQLIYGMQEIRLNNSDKQKRWEWEQVQAKLFKIDVKSTVLEQYQVVGGFFINEFKNIIITILAAKSVIDGDITLGMMLSIQYIIGQLNAPLTELIHFINELQHAKISLERVVEIRSQENEEVKNESSVNIFPEKKSIHLQNVTFQYEGPHSPKILDDIEFFIPEGKITAIVGTSGSGKTTLLKLLLKFYPPTNGQIKVGDVELKNLSSRLWRQKCGVVMQDGYLFTDTIASNIIMSNQDEDYSKLVRAAKIANIHDFIQSLPMRYNTVVGNDGLNLSKGQIQRLLIARAVYKDPEYLFFDEATSSLDANNERKIMQNLNEFYKGRTVVVIAHRLSTVKNADQIILLEKGQIKEVGNHHELVLLKGSYFELVRNQLELGN